LNERHKDRVSYSLDPFQVDLTQVKTTGREVTHELEIEFTDSTDFVCEITSGDTFSKRSYEYIGAFLNNIRILARKFK
jgi:hypothetical protein